MSRDTAGERMTIAANRGKGLRTVVLCTACALPVARSIAAQQPAAPPSAFAYEVVSIKPHDPGAQFSSSRYSDDGFSLNNISLKSLVTGAYNLKMEDFVFGLSGPVADARFDVQAKMDAETVASFKKLTPKDRTEVRAQMTRSLLEDRFKLKAHRETKEMPVFSLIVAKGGFKLKPADPNDTYANGLKGPDGVAFRGGSMRFTMESLQAQAITMTGLAGSLQGQSMIHRLVIDNTGEAGKYDFELHWYNEDMHHNDTDPPGPSLFAALEEQLGLKLESTKATVDTVVVDHAEKPSEN